MKRNNMTVAATTLVASLFLLTLGASSASAITYQLTSDHCTNGCGTPPFGTVDLTASGSNVNVTVTLASGYTYAQTGAGDGQIFKFNGVGVALTDIVVGAHVPALAAATGNFNGDGGGQYLFGINCPTCGNGPTGFGGAVLFTVNNATIADLTVPNNLNQIFVADVLAPNGNTGLVDVSGSAVPDGGMTLTLLGGALVGLETLRRRVRV